LLPPEVIVVLKALGAVLLLAIALLLVARTIARWRPRLGESDATPEERDSVFEADRLRQTLLAWLRRLLRRFRPAEAVSDAQLGSATGDAVHAGPSSVRLLYRQLLALGQLAGRSRAASTTPYEHAPALTTVLQPPAAVDDLTEAYVQVRYAEHELTSAEIEALEERFRHVLPK